jgi:hypothetical protein
MNIAQQLQFFQQKTDTINQALAAIADQSKVLSADILKALVLYARGREVDGRMTTNPTLLRDYQLNVLAGIEGGHYQQIQALTAQLSDQLATMEVLTNQLTSLRAYLQVGTAEELSAAVAAGHSVPLSTAEVAAAKARASERAAQAQAHQTSTTKP